MPTIQQIKHFCALTEFESFIRAAESIGISQPALSRSIANLEEEFQLKLVSRKARGVVPTEFGETVLASFHRLMAEMTDLDQEARAYRRIGTGNLLVASGIIYEKDLFDPCVLEIAIEYPDLQIVARKGFLRDLLPILRSGGIDILVAGIAPDQAEMEGFRITPIANIEVSFLVRSGHPLIGKSNLTLEDFVDYQIASLAILTNHSPIDRSFGRLLPKERQIPDVVLASDTVLERLTEQSDTITWTLSTSFSAAVAEKRLVKLDLNVDEFTQRVCFIERQHYSRSIIVAEFANRFAAHMTALQTK